MIHVEFVPELINLFIQVHSVLYLWLYMIDDPYQIFQSGLYMCATT